MKITKQGLKELLDNSSSISITDELPLEDLLLLAEFASDPEKHLTIRVKRKGLEDLKKIADASKGNISFIIE